VLFYHNINLIVVKIEFILSTLSLVFNYVLKKIGDLFIFNGMVGKRRDSTYNTYHY